MQYEKIKLTTDRLTIRTMRPDDYKAVGEIWRDSSRSPYAQYDAPHIEGEDEVKKHVKFLSESGEFFLVLLKNTDTAVGTLEMHDTGSSHEIGFCFLSAQQGKGYARESCTALIEHFAEKGCKRFTAGAALKNTPSVRLLMSLGFRQTGTEQVSFYKDENGRDIYFEGGIFELEH